MLRIDIHFEVRKKSPWEIIQSNQYEVTIYRNISTKQNVSSIHDSKNFCFLFFSNNNLFVLE